MKSGQSWAFAATVALGVAFAAPAGAQQRTDTVEYAGPNRALLRSGAWTLGLSYAPALVVGIQSDLPADRYLLVPVAGPWLDLANRDDCPGCDYETLNRVLLVTDGVFQGLGSLQIIGSFLFFERRETTVVSRAKAGESARNDFSIRFAPKRYRDGGYGFAAIGTF